MLQEPDGRNRLELLAYTLQECAQVHGPAGGGRIPCVGLARPEGQYQMLGKVGNGFSDAERKKWLKAVQGTEVESNYLEVSGSNVAFTMVKPELVIQVRCLDLLAETARGPIRRPVLTLDRQRCSSTPVRAVR